MGERIVRSLFDPEARACEYCRRTLPKDYTDTICPNCKENELFSRVKDYIRANDVTEFQVADHFEIPLSKVKGWIREGRIEYKELHTPALINLHCQHCGEPIQFGTLCSKCQRKANTKGSTGHAPSGNADEKFRFL